jgi:hypothetical protein
LGREDVVIDRVTDAAVTVMESDLVTEAAGEEESVTCTVKVEVPAVVGVPEITPAELRLSPAGRDPDVRDQV